MSDSNDKMSGGTGADTAVSDTSSPVIDSSTVNDPTKNGLDDLVNALSNNPAQTVLRNKLGEIVKEKEAKRVQALTPAQEALLVEYRNKWIRAGQSTLPGDRFNSEDGITKAYVAAGLKPPKFVWFPSPMQAVITAVNDTESKGLKLVVKQVYEEEIEKAKKAVLEQVETETIRTVEKQVRDEVGKCMAAATIVGCEIADRVASLKIEGAEKAVQDMFLAACFGQFEAAWFSHYEYMWQVLSVSECARLDGLFQAAKSCGMFWTFEDVVYASGRPSKVLYDEEGKLHSATGNAIEYSGDTHDDVFGACVWHGTRVPAEAVITPANVTWDLIEARPEKELKESLAEIKAFEWCGSRDCDEYNAALAAKRLGGIEAMKALILGDAYTPPITETVSEP